MRSRQELQLFYVSGLRAFIALHDLKGNVLAFFEGAEAATYDTGEVHENVLSAVLRRNEAVALLCVKPFHFTFHLACPLYVENVRPAVRAESGGVCPVGSGPPPLVSVLENCGQLENNGLRYLCKLGKLREPRRCSLNCP